MFNKYLPDGSPNFEIPDSFKFVMMKDWLKTLEQSVYLDADQYQRFVEFISEHFPDFVDTDKDFELIMSGIFAIHKLGYTFENVVEAILGNRLIDSVYRHFVSET